jgi:hypothetical protein
MAPQPTIAIFAIRLLPGRPAALELRFDGSDF